MHGAAYDPFSEGVGGGGENFILIEVSSANCSYKDRCFASSCVKALFLFFSKKRSCKRKVFKIRSCQRPPQAAKAELLCVPRACPYSVDNKARGKCDSVQPASC